MSHDAFDAAAREFSAKLREVEIRRGEKLPPPPRADELADRKEERTEAIRLRLELAKSSGLAALDLEGRRLLRALTTTRASTLGYGDLLATVVAFRDFSAWDNLIHFVDSASALYTRQDVPFKRLHPVAQQYGMALNRVRHRVEAVHVLTTVVAKHGEDAETQGILGRVYKDIWQESRGTSNADPLLFRSINAYAKGVLANPGELYPAINLMTLFTAAGASASALKGIAEHVYNLFKERQRDSRCDYFDYATAVEFYALSGEWRNAHLMLDEALRRVRAGWELKTTAANLEILLHNGSESRSGTQLRELQKRLNEADVPDTLRPTGDAAFSSRRRRGGTAHNRGFSLLCFL